MNNLKYIVLALPLVTTLCYGQSGNVGINTPKPQGILHIDGGKDNPKDNTPITNTQQANDFIIKKNTPANGNTEYVMVGSGTLVPKVKLDLRTTDGSNAAMGIGTTTLTAPQANEGAIRYDPSNTGQEAKIEYSNGLEWIPLYNNPPQKKSYVIATKADSKVVYGAVDGNINVNGATQTGLSNNGVNYMSSWNKKYESTGSNNSNTNFNATNGVFTAPADGTYIASFTYALSPITINSNGQPAQIEAIWRLFDNSTGWNTASNLIQTVKCANSFSKDSTSSIVVGANCTATFYMFAGQRLVPYTWFNLNDLTSTTKINLNSDSNFNNLTIVQK